MSSDCGTLLDFGCGEGSLLALIPAAQKIGVDVIAEHRKAVEAKGYEALETLEPVPEMSVDTVISHHSLEHTLEPFSQLGQIRRVLKRDGRLILVVPADDWRVYRSDDPDDRNHHLYTWTPLSLANLLREAGFTVDSSCIEHHGLPGRLTDPLNRALSPRQFALVTKATAYLKRRREIVAVSHPA